MNEESFLQQRFRSYYNKNRVLQPPEIQQREFGIGGLGKKISQRHLAFPSIDSFNQFLRQETPFFVSYSAAYYHKPDARPMEAKGWKGADLIFEFDADDLKTECKQAHDQWHCLQCGAHGKGSLEACTSCGAVPKVDEWTCPSCLQAVKKQVDDLLDLLENDLSFFSNLSVNFSGSKGFHVHVRSTEAKQLSPRARIEVLDFLMGQGLDLQRVGFAEHNKALYAAPFHQAKGWQKRILQSVFGLLEKNDAALLAVAGNCSVRTAEKILEKREAAIESIRKGLFPSWVSSKPLVFWQSVLSFAADSLKLNIDRQTSLDKFKIVRVPETLHGSTGLKAQSISFEKWKNFDALTETVVFSDSLFLVETTNVPRFFLNNQWFGPFAQETVELPEFAAVFLVARGSARLSEKPQ